MFRYTTKSLLKFTSRVIFGLCSFVFFYYVAFKPMPVSTNVVYGFGSLAMATLAFGAMNILRQRVGETVEVRE